MHYDIYPIEVEVELRMKETQRAAAQERLARLVVGERASKGRISGILARAVRVLDAVQSLAPSTAQMHRLTR